MARKRWERAVSLGWVALAATAWVGCESEGESPSADAGAMGGMESVVPDRPFPEFTTDDLVTNDVLGVVTVADRLLIGFEAEAGSASIAAALAAAA